MGISFVSEFVADVILPVTLFLLLVVCAIVSVVSEPVVFSTLLASCVDFGPSLIVAAELSVELYMLDSSPFVFTGSAPQLGKIRHRARHKHTGHKITVRFIKVLLSQQ